MTRERSEAEILQRAAAYCSTAERCVQDVEKKIQNAGLAPDAVQRIIDRLLKEKFIDESRFCRSFVNDKFRFNKWGRIKIGYELRRKNIAENIISDTLSSIDEEEYSDLLLKLIKEKKKSTRSKDERDLYYKLLRFAAGRGFESNEIHQCLKRMRIETDEDFME